MSKSPAPADQLERSSLDLTVTVVESPPINTTSPPSAFGDSNFESMPGKHTANWSIVN